jgi:hypothetical protein
LVHVDSPNRCFINRDDSGQAGRTRIYLDRLYSSLPRLQTGISFAESMGKKKGAQVVRAFDYVPDPPVRISSNPKSF